MRPLLAIIFAGILAASSYAQQIELQIETRTLQEGDTAEMSLICTNTGDPATPQFEVPAGLELRLLNPNPARSSMVSLISGRRSESTTYTFSLRLTGTKAGSYTLKPIVVQAGGDTYKTDPLPITVTKPAADAAKDGDKLVFARIAAQPVSLFVTQTVEATLTLAIRKFERDGQVVEMGNMLNLVDASGSDLSVFGTRFNSSEITLADSNGVKHTYLVYKQSKDVRAEQVGTMKIGPVFFKVNYPVSLRRSLFGGVEPAQSRRETARAAAIDIEVKGPPSDNRPPDYGGAIGQYEFSVAAKPTRVEQGQPVTLTITIKGDPIDGIAGPDLKQYPELSARFDFTADESPGEKEGGSRVFRRAIFPRREGEQTIPSLSWSYFDPSTQKYVTRVSPPIPIIVDPSTSPETLSDTASLQASPGKGLTRTSGGISPNIVDPGLVLVDHDFKPQPVVLGAVAVAPPAICFAAMLISWRGARMRGDVNFSRRRAAGRKAKSRIAMAGAQNSPSEQLHELAEALTGYISDRFGLPPGELTPGDAQQIVMGRTGNQPLAKSVADFLASCDMARFAGQSAATANPSKAAREATRLIGQIERAAT